MFRSSLRPLACMAGVFSVLSMVAQSCSRATPYIVGGGGYYRRTVEFTQPTTEIITAFDPFYGFFPAAVPANIVLGSFTQNKGGLNGGAGVSVRIRGDSSASFFAEARYH